MPLEHLEGKPIGAPDESGFLVVFTLGSAMEALPIRLESGATSQAIGFDDLLEAIPTVKPFRPYLVPVKDWVNRVPLAVLKALLVRIAKALPGAGRAMGIRLVRVADDPVPGHASPPSFS